MKDDVISRQAAVDALCDEYCGGWQDCKHYPKCENLKVIQNLPSAQEWIPCSERLPDMTALVTVETKVYKNRYVCEAVWIPRWSKKAEYDSWEDCSEYNEDEDEYYVLEGWYERVHNWDEYSYVGIEDNVIAWQPLTEPYKGEQDG